MIETDQASVGSTPTKFRGLRVAAWVLMISAIAALLLPILFTILDPQQTSTWPYFVATALFAAGLMLGLLSNRARQNPIVDTRAQATDPRPAYTTIYSKEDQSQTQPPPRSSVEMDNRTSAGVVKDLRFIFPAGLLLVLIRMLALWIYVPLGLVAGIFIFPWLLAQGATAGAYLGWLDANFVYLLIRTVLRPFVRGTLPKVIPFSDIHSVRHRIGVLDAY